MLVATTTQVHDIIVWWGHDYQLVGVQGEGRFAICSSPEVAESRMSEGAPSERDALLALIGLAAAHRESG
jgi:hypothetical protein